jgi:4-hydroxy-tetrahydrodipicolinate reductase
VKIVLFGASGKVGSALAPRLAAAGHEVTPVGRGNEVEPVGHDAAVDFTRPDAVRANVERALAAGVPCVVGTTGLDEGALGELDGRAKEGGLACFVAPNFAVGAVLMMRLAAEAARFLPRAEIVELHHETKVDAPSGTAKATAQRLGNDVPIHSVRLPGLVAHQEVLLGGDGQLLTIRHDTFSREAFVPGVLLALERLHGLPPGVTVGLDALLGP